MSVKPVKLFSLFIFIFSFSFYLWNLDQPSGLYWDELLHVESARSILAKQKPYAEMTQPPLGKEMIALSLVLFGDNPQGARTISAIAGALALSVIFLCAYSLTQNLFFSFIAFLLLFTDPLFYLHSRLATLDMLLVLFMMISLYSFLLIYQKDEKNLYRTHFYILGTFLGVAASIKAVALVMGVPFFILLLQKIRRVRQEDRKNMFIHLFLGLYLPLLIIFRLSYSLIGYSEKEMFDHLKWIANFLSTLKSSPHLTSRWEEWILVQSPIWYLWEQVQGSNIYAVLAFGNYAFWFGAEFLILIGLVFWKKMDVLFWAFFSIIILQFLFWIPKPATHLYYMLSVLPFYALMSVQVLKALKEKYPAGRRIIYSGSITFALISMFVFYYYFPLVSGKPLSIQQAKSYPILGIEKSW